MPIYLPRYLDRTLLRDVLDYLEVDIPDVSEVEVTTASDRGGKLGINHYVEAGIEGKRRQERRDAFTQVAQPGRLLTLALETAQGELIKLDEAPDSALVQRALVLVTGLAELTRASEIPQMIDAFMPIILKQQASPEALSNSDAVNVMFGSDLSNAPMVMNFQTDTAYSFVLLLRRSHLVDGSTIEDLEDELTVFGICEKVLGVGQKMSLERFVLPGLNRTLRRSQGGVSQMLEGLPGEPLTPDDLEFVGPGAVIRPIALFP